MSVEVIELCHAVRENIGKTVGFGRQSCLDNSDVLRSVFSQCCLTNSKVTAPVALLKGSLLIQTHIYVLYIELKFEECYFLRL